MQEKISDDRIDELIGRIDSFMENGGGRMNVAGGDGDPAETHCTSCCGEFCDPGINAPANDKE